MKLAAPAFAPLPPAAVTLLDSFQRAFEPATARLWARHGSQWLCLFPEEGPAAAEPGPASVRVPLGGGGGTTYELEILGAGAGDGGVVFLGDALRSVLSYEREALLAARELSERYEEINLLYSISEILGSVLSLDDAAKRILGEVADVLGARRASLWVFDPGAQELRLAAAVGDDGLRGPIRADDPHAVTARVFRERQPLSLERGRTPPAGTRLEPDPAGKEAFLSVPISYTPPEGGSRTVGVITLIGGGGRFTAGDTRLLTAIATQVGAAIERHRLVEESLRRERLVRELELAHDLQLKLLPATSEFEGPARVAARCMPADSVGGDFYHLFRLAGGRLGVMIGDVSGHGFSAALIMALTMSAVAIYAQEAGPPGEVLRRVHDALIDELETTEMFLSLFYGVIDPAAGTLVYASAGHPHAFRIDDQGAAERLGSTSPPLGTFPLADYGEGKRAWRRERDLLFLFTDGLSDAFARSEGGMAGGEARLVQAVAAARSLEPDQIMARLFSLAERARPAVPPDDRTAVLVRA